MKRFFKGIVHLGVRPDLASDLIDEIKVINSIKLQGAVIIWLTGLVTMFFMPAHVPFILALLTFHLAAATMVFLLNQGGKYTMAKWLFVIDPAILTLVLTGYFGVQSNFYFIAILCFMMYIYLFRFRQRMDRTMIWVYMMVSVIGVFFINQFDLQIGDPSPEEIKIIRIAVFTLSIALSVMMGVVLQRSNKLRTARTRETLEESQKDAVILQSISDYMEEAIFKSSMKTGFVFVNEAFAKIFGYQDKDEIIDTHPVNLYKSKNDRDALLTKILKQGKVNNTLLHYRKKDGSFFWGRLNCQLITEEDEEFLIGTIVDVTPQQEQTERLEESEHQLKEAQKLAKLGNWRMCPNDKDVQWSAECARIHGFLPSEEDAPFERWIDGLQDISLAEIKSGIEKGAQMNVDFEFGSWYVNPTGEHRFLNYICRLDRKATRLFWYGTVQDNTEMKMQELELISTREFYQNILDSIPVETVLIDEENKYFYISKNAVGDDELRNWLKGKGNADYAQYRKLPDDFAEKRDGMFRKAFESDLTVRWEEKMKTKDGRDSYHLRNLIPINLQYGQTLKRFLIGYSFDINDIKTAQFRLERNNDELKKLNKELDRFVYSISHDLRAPIASVLGLNALAEDTKDQEEMQSLLAMQREALDRLDRYIRDVIDYARNKRLDLSPEQVDLQRLVQECMADLEYMSNYDRIEYFTELDPSCNIVTDPVRMKIIVNNLLSNAIKYADSSKEKSFVSIKGARQNGELKLVIADNGIGIKDEFKDHIWDIFFRGISNIPGSGLGLYILNESIKNIHGRVKMESEEGKGTTFELQIPSLED